MASNTAAEAARHGELRTRLAAVDRYADETEQLRAQTLRMDCPVAPEFALIAGAIASASSDSVFVLDAGRLVIYANQVAEITFGYTCDEFRGRCLERLLRHAFLASENPHFGIFTAREVVRDSRDTLFHKNGSPIQVAISIAPMAFDGCAQCAVVTVRDLTGEERARRELRESNERLATALANADLGVWHANFLTGEAYWDQRMKSMFGLAPNEEITVSKAEEFIHPEDFALREEILNARPEPNGDVQWEWRIVRRDGMIRWHQGRGRVTRDAAGRAVSAHGVTRDVTDLRRAQEIRERLAAVVGSSEDGIASASLDGTITSWNRGAELIFGYSATEIIGQSASVLSPADRAGEQLAFLDRIRQGEAACRYVTERQAKDNRKITVSVTLSPMRNDAGVTTGVSIVFRDITQQKLMEEKVRQSEKMEAVGRLAGGIAHDFNNLLTIVIGCADMAMVDTADELLLDYLTSIKSASERATELTRRLLAFSRKQILQPEIINMNDVLQGMLPLLRRAIREDIPCATKLAAGLAAVKADPCQIEEALLNLVINAADAVGSGGAIDIETKNVTLCDEYARTHPRVIPGKYVMLAVHDNGIGIEPSLRDRIFEPFFTTKPPGKGTGLGLAMVYGFICQSGGHITCDSNPSFGTTFNLYLPAVEDAVPAVSAQEDLPVGAVGGSETILLAEDDAEVRTWMANLLRGLGYRVLEALDGSDVITAGSAYRDSIDLLVSDVVMPGLGGPTLAAVLRPVATRMKVLYISGYAGQNFDQMGSAFLPKPFTPVQLARKVRQVLAAPLALVQKQRVEE